MAIIGRDQALARQLGQKRPGGGGLYGGPPQPPTPAPAAPQVQSGDMDSLSTADLLNRTWDTGGKSGGGGDGGFGSAIMGGLGTVLGGAAKKLDWVSNLGMLGAEELSEFLGRDEFESQKNADGTLNEFGKQGNWEKLNDPEYGFGKLMGNATGNKWADRTLGFVGDVAFDAFSYVGGAAVKSTMVMGKAGREALVVKAAGLGMSDDVATHLGKFGHVGLDDATREALGVKRAGVYWGVGDASIRLPGTKTIGTAAEKTFGSVRRNTAGRLVGKVGKGRGEESLAIFRRVAQTGKTIDGVTPKIAGLTLGLVNRFKASSGEFAEPFARLAQKSFQSWDDATRVRVTKEIESLNFGWTADMGPKADPAKLAKLSPEAQEVIALRDLIYSSLNEATGGAVDMGFRGPGYMPHRSTREAWDFFGDDSAVRQLLNGGDLDSGQGAALKRVFLPGKTVDVKGRAITFGDASIDDINAKLTAAFPEAGVTKWVEDNSVVLVERYISEMSRIRGHHAMLTDAVEKNALGSVKHMTDDIVEGMLNVSKNAQVRDFLKDELAQRATHQSYLRGEAARVGQLISKELDGALVRMADEAGAEHATLKRFVDGIQKELKDDAGDRTANLKRISEKFDAERKRLAAVAEKMFNAKAVVDADVAALEQRIIDGFVQESAQTRKLLDEWIASSNSYAQKLKVETAAREGLTTLDEMYGLVFAQAGRLDEVADSPDLLMEVFADMRGMNLVGSKSPLLEEVRVDVGVMQAAKENQELLELLEMDGTFTNWEEAVDAIGDAAGNPYLTQGRVDIRLSMVNTSLKKMDEGIEAEYRAVADLRVGAWEQTGVTLDGTPLDKHLVELNKESVATRNKAVRQLTSSSDLSKKKVEKEVALQQTRDLENVKRQLIGLKKRVEAKAKETSTVQSKIELEELTIARDKMMARYSKLEDSSLSYVTQKVNSRGAKGLTGGDLYEDQLTDEIIGLLNEMKAARKAIIEADQVIKNNSVSPQMADWLDATGPGSPLMKLRRKRAWLAQEQTELQNWISPSGGRRVVGTEDVDGVIGRQMDHVWRTRGSWEDTAQSQMKGVDSKVIKSLNGVAQKARDNTQKALQSSGDGQPKGTLANALKKLREAAAVRDEVLTDSSKQVGPYTAQQQSVIRHQQVAIAREKLLVQYLEMEERTMYMAAEQMKTPSVPGLGGVIQGVSNDLPEAVKYMKVVRQNLEDTDAWLYDTSDSPLKMREWLDATGIGAQAHELKRKRWIMSETQAQINTRPSTSSKTIVDTAALEQGRKALRARKAAGSSVELFDEEAARINSGVVTGASRVEQAPLLGPGAPYGPELPTYRLDTQPFYDPQRPAPTFPETYRAGSMENARVIDRRDLAQNILFMQDLDRAKGTYWRRLKYIDDDGVIKTRYEDVTTEVPVVANPRTREELEKVIKVAQKDVDAQQQIIDGLAYIPSTAGVIDEMVRGEINPAVLNVMRTLLDGVEDGVDSARKAAKNYDNERRKFFPQTWTPSHDKFKKGELPRPVNSPKHPDFKGNYQDWLPDDQELFNRANELSKIEHSTQSFTREQYDEWEALGKRADGSGKYDPDSPFNLKWKQTPPYETLGSNELAPDVLGMGQIRQIDEDEAGNQLTQSVGDLIGFKKDGSLSSRVPQRRGGDDGYGGMAPDGSMARDGGQDLVSLKDEALDALKEAKNTRDLMYASLGLSDDLVRQAAGGGVGTQRNVLLFARESFEGKVSYAADGVPTTPRQLAKEVSDNYGGDFAAYKADFPDTKAKDFLPPVGSGNGGLGYKESAKALGGDARNFNYGTENFAKYVDASDQREMGNMKARDILEQMDPEDRQKIYSYARQQAGEVRKHASIERKLKQAELDEATEQLLGQKNLREKLKRGAGNTRKAQDKFHDKAAKVRSDADAPRQTLIDEINGLRPSQAEMADDGPFGVNKLIEVENAIGKQEAAEMAQLDAVRSSLEADGKVFTEHKGWAESRLNRIKALRKRTGKKGLSGHKWSENTTEEQFAKRLDEFENVLRLSMVEGPDSRSFAATARLMDNYMNQLKGLDDFNRQTEGIEALYHKAAAGADGGKGFNLDMQRAMLDGYERLDSNLFPDFADMTINSQLKQNLENWMGAMNDDLNLKWFDEATQIFKSYATMTPGFHLRNYMGATFMNFSDGVTVADTRAANKHWRGYVADPQNYIKNLDDPQERAAFQAVFGVGAGGSFDPGEVGSGAGRMWKGLRSNKATRMSRRYGEDLVEGPVRLAAALNTTRRGGTMNDAMARVKRLHFDYSDLSALDQKIKRVIPFYMFMSRNLPLQIEQMWRRPKAYAVYNHFMNNFDESDENTLMPKYLKDAGAIVMGSSWFGDDSKDFVFAPDLQHNNLMQDIMAFSGQGEQGIPIVDGLLASGNPIVTKGVEIAFNHSGFRGGDAFFNKKKDEYGNWEDKSMKEQALERIMYGLEGVLTPTGTAKGLLGYDPLGSEESNERLQDRQLQKTLNFGGLSFKQLGDFERDWERRRQEKEGQ